MMIDTNPEDDWNQYCADNQVLEDQQLQFCKDLTAFQIAEAFPEECKEYIPELLRSLKLRLKLKKGYDKDIVNRINFYEQIIRILNSGMEDITQEVIDRANTVPIESLVEIKKPHVTSQRIVCLCMFHVEHSGSLIIYKNNNTYYCFACGVGGDAVDFTMRLNKMTFKQAIQYLIKKG